jgi:hypothetical protein
VGWNEGEELYKEIHKRYGNLKIQGNRGWGCGSSGRPLPSKSKALRSNPSMYIVNIYGNVKMKSLIQVIFANKNVF